MMKRFVSYLLFFLPACLFALVSCGGVGEKYDVVIIGGGTSGVAAGIEAARGGAKTLVVEENLWLGGMLTSAGVSATDGCYKLRGGIWGEFRTALEKHYGSAEALQTGWVSNIQFEPSVGDSIFKAMCAAEKNLTVIYSSTLANATRSGGSWLLSIRRKGGEGVALTSESAVSEVRAKVLVDATELGDVAKMVGVPYDIGMDSRAETGERIAPERANGIVQDMTYVATLKDYGHDVTIPRPEGYDSTLFLCCCTNSLCARPKEQYRMWGKEEMITYGKLPGGKYMINWPLEGNDLYVNLIELDSAGRAAAVAKAKNRTLCFLYFMQTNLGFSNLGLADDEYPTADRLPFTPYYRESRRIRGVIRFSVNDMCAPYDREYPLYRTAIAVGDYPVDHHHTQYSDWEELPDLHFHPVPSYGLPMGVMLPKEPSNFIVAEKSISVTNIANGSTRLQPVVLQLGQAAGALAALAVKGRCDVSEVPVRSVQKVLLDDGCYLLPYLDRVPSDSHFKSMQRIGATGILRGRGVCGGWENQTWFDADSIVACSVLDAGLREFYGEAGGWGGAGDAAASPGGAAAVSDSTAAAPASVPEAVPAPAASAAPSAVGTAASVPGLPVTLRYLVSAVAGIEKSDSEKLMKKVTSEWSSLGLSDFDASRPLTRLECAVVIDRFLDPFSVPVDIFGRPR